MMNVTVIFIGGNYASTSLGPMEVFHSAGLLFPQLHGEQGAPRFHVTSASLRQDRMESAYSVGLMAQTTIEAIERTDLVIVPAVGLDVYGQLTANQPLYPWLRRQAEQGAWIAGACSGAAFLAAAGLLDGRTATSHWGLAQTLPSLFPKVKWRMDRLITEDRRVLCSGGVYASIDLSLYLVEKFCGRELALQTAKSLCVDMPRSRQSAYALLPLSRPHEDEAVRRAEEQIESEFAEDVSVERLARGLHMSARNFIRRFKSATGCTPGQYLQATRIAKAKSMLEAGARHVESVGNAVGYQDSAFFRAAFRRATGMSPAEYRARFSSSGSKNRSQLSG